MTRTRFPSFSLVLPEGWADFTESHRPRTLGKPDGVGALQFTTALYVSGQVPNPDPKTLYEMLLAFAAPHADGPARDVNLENAPLCLASASFDLPPDDFLRAWFISNAGHFAQITYVCSRSVVGPELTEAEAIVRSLKLES
jgi:hypothetical protein